MWKRTLLFLALAALTLPAAAQAQNSATFVMTSGEKLAVQLVDLGAGGFTVRVNNQERKIPTNQVAVIDFMGTDMTDADWAKFNAGSHAVVLRNGETVNGRLFDIAGTTPKKIIIKTDSGSREFSATEIGRIVMSRPGSSAVATSGAAQVPAGEGIAVSANQQWTPTGRTVRRGEILNFSSTGEARLSTDSADVAHASGALSQRRAQGSPLPEHFAGALIARVGNGDPFPIGGPTATVTMPAAGELFLGVNDDNVGDNQGGFRVNIQRSGRRR